MKDDVVDISYVQCLIISLKVEEVFAIDPTCVSFERSKNENVLEAKEKSKMIRTLDE